MAVWKIVTADEARARLGSQLQWQGKGAFRGMRLGFGGTVPILVLVVLFKGTVHAGCTRILRQAELLHKRCRRLWRLCFGGWSAGVKSLAFRRRPGQERTLFDRVYRYRDEAGIPAYTRDLSKGELDATPQHQCRFLPAAANRRLQDPVKEFK